MRKNICKKGKFIDEVFGENIEYVKIYNENGITIIFEIDNHIVIKEFKNVRELIEKFIEKYIEAKYLDEILIEQEQEIDSLQRDKQDIKAYLKATLKSAENKLEEKNYICNQ